MGLSRADCIPRRGHGCPRPRPYGVLGPHLTGARSPSMISRLTRSRIRAEIDFFDAPAERVLEAEVGDVPVVCCGSGDAGVGCAGPGELPASGGGRAAPGRTPPPPPPAAFGSRGRG